VIPIAAIPQYTVLNSEAVSFVSFKDVKRTEIAAPNVSFKAKKYPPSAVPLTEKG
jgi:hypothetical protein